MLQGDSISQWWQWQQQQQNNVTGPGSHVPTSTKGHLHGSTTTLKANVVRTSSLKDSSKYHPNPEDSDDEYGENDDVFVTADPVRGQHVTVKSAIISTTNPYCTAARVSKRRFGHPNRSTTRWDVSSGNVETSAPSPSSDSSDSSLVLSSGSSSGSHSPHTHATSASVLSHDQDSGYDGYCPDKSITSIGSASETSSATEDSSHYGNNLTSTPNAGYVQFASSAAIYGRIGQLRGKKSERPQSVYEKQFGGPVQQLLSSPPQPSQRSQQVSIGQATVINLVSTNKNEPPPLPPRPSGVQNNPGPAPSVTEPKPQQHVIKHTSTSLPRRRVKKSSTAVDLNSSFTSTSVIKRQSIHDVGGTSLSVFAKPIDTDEVEINTQPIPKVRQIQTFSKIQNSIFVYDYRNKGRNFAHYLGVEQVDNSLVFKQPNLKKDRARKVWDFLSLVVKIVPKAPWAFMSKQFFPMDKHWEYSLKVFQFEELIELFL